MDDEFDYEMPPTLRERALDLYFRALPYAVGGVVLCVLLYVVCTYAAGIEDPHGTSQWNAALDSAMRNLNNQRNGQ